MESGVSNTPYALKDCFPKRTSPQFDQLRNELSLPVFIALADVGFCPKTKT